jgi:FkbM family methyltransferase
MRSGNAAVGSKRDSTLRDGADPVVPISTPDDDRVLRLRQRGLASRAIATFREQGWRAAGRKLVNHCAVWRRLAFEPHEIRIATYGLNLRFYLGDAITEAWYAGAHETPELDWILSQLDSDALLVDCGAHHGIFTLIAAAKARAAVLAIEASPSSAAVLRRNVAANRISNVEVLHAAVGDVDGTLRFSRDSCGSVTNSDDSITVPAVTLDAALAGRVPGVIKIDVEGAELRVLHGARRTIAAHRPALDIEVHSGVFENPAATVAAIFEELRPFSYDFSVQVEEDGKLSPLGLDPARLGKFGRFWLYASAIEKHEPGAAT